MNKVPLALLLCLAGLFFVLHVDKRPPDFQTLLLFLFHAVDDLTTFFSWARRPGLPMNVFGHVLVVCSLSWIAFAFYRHLRPARPILTFSPAGVSYHVSWLKDLLIPWHEIQRVDGLEFAEGSGPPHRFPETTVVLVSKEFYERNILPKRGFLSGRFWKQMFWPKGSLMQMVLHHELFAIDSKDIRGPLEARWKAFRDRPTPAPSDCEPVRQAPQVYGIWSIDGSLWQAIKFLAPLLGIIAILTHATIV